MLQLGDDNLIVLLVEEDTYSFAYDDDDVEDCFSPAAAAKIRPPYELKKFPYILPPTSILSFCLQTTNDLNQ